jgi:hypothetical protein
VEQKRLEKCIEKTVAIGLTDHHERCTKQFVLIVVVKPKCRLNQQKEDLSIAGSALGSIDLLFEEKSSQLL